MYYNKPVNKTFEKEQIYDYYFKNLRTYKLDT